MNDVAYRIKMKIKPNYKIRKIAGETIIVNQGTANVDMTRIISLNESACLLYQALSGQEFSVEDVAKVLVDSYGINEEQALADAGKWISALKECGVIE